MLQISFEASVILVHFLRRHLRRVGSWLLNEALLQRLVDATQDVCRLINGHTLFQLKTSLSVEDQTDSLQLLID